MYRIYKLYWIKGNNSPLSLLIPTHYAISIPQSCPIQAQNPLPISCSAAYNTLDPLGFFSIKAWGARIRNLFPSFTTSKSKGFFAGKITAHTIVGGESKVLPHLYQRGFEGVLCNFPLSSVELR